MTVGKIFPAVFYVRLDVIPTTPAHHLKQRLSDLCYTKTVSSRLTKRLAVRLECVPK